MGHHAEEPGPDGYQSSSGDTITSRQHPGESASTINTTNGISEKAQEKTPNEWSLAWKVREMNDQDVRSGLKRRELGVTWENLTVEVPSVDSAVNHNFFSQFNIPQHIQDGRQKAPQTKILDNSHGCVKPGEMLLVLGRPGSGCTTLLKLLANRRGGYSKIDGEVFYGSMNHKEATKYRGQIVMNTEEEIFFPSLTVGDTMDFATRLKVPAQRPQELASAEDYRLNMKDFLLKSMGIEHTNDTKVGNEYVRGVSGGERKRVSIIETLATEGSVLCWDNSTRGLDASTALEWTKCLRTMTDVYGLSTIATLYQAGNGIYDLFDKVLVLDEGQQIYYGPTDEARPFLESTGFICRDGANVGDFLTGVTVPTEREIKPGYEHSFPRTASSIRTLYEASPSYTKMVQEYDYPQSSLAKERTASFEEAVALNKHKSVLDSSPFTVSLYEQVRACIIRQAEIIWNDKATFLIKQVSTLIQALVVGSVFYDAPADSSGLFIKSGSLFFAMLYNGILTPMSEVTDSFAGRPMLVKHKHFAYFHPSAFCIAQIVLDIPIILLQISHFSLVLYFMSGLQMSAAAFFTYWIMLFATAMCMTSMFRAVGAAFPNFDAATKLAGFLVTALIMYTGYMIQRHQMHPWFGWIFWINPLAYGFEAILATEFHNTEIDCVYGNLVPSGPGYNDSSRQACSGVLGAPPGSSSLTGDQYLSALSYSHSHVWRNFGIIWAYWFLYVVVTIVFTTAWKDGAESGPSLLIPQEKRKQLRPTPDSEAQSDYVKTEPNSSPAAEKSDDGSSLNLVKNTSVFTWKDLTYTVKTPTGDRVLLDNVYGWVAPGTLTALMGASGAGKTTLLDVLAQRKTEGTINGSVLVDGRPLPISFQRSTGYCEQLDVHEPLATVKEALQFSALLRQPGNVSREEKFAYVDTIIELLELHDIADTLIGKVGAGLSVEQRKRVTIGVELVSKPKILIFLDEPTSGLDGQSAFNTVRFLRKLADCGQAVLVTIHQPSAQLFYQFDNLLLLARGGKMVYFSEIGENGSQVKDYFARYGAPCPTGTNPAEFMIDVVSGNIVDSSHDWHQTWVQSPEHTRMTKELDHIISDAANKPAGFEDDGREFATSLWEQTKLVTHRMNIALYRNTDYINNKIILHIALSLFNGFSFWKIGDSVNALQLGLFAIWNIIFVAPGVINQLQPLFIERRDIYDAREKKSRMYSWKAFVTGLIVSEFPYLCICAVAYFVCFYYTVGFPTDSNKAGASFFNIFLYEFIYTGIGQMVAAYAPNATFAALVNPLVIGTLVTCCGVLVPYHQITEFWRYWLYYLNPFTYVSGAFLVFNLFGREVQCEDHEFAVFNPPSGDTCAEYLASYLNGFGARANLVNPDATESCRVCQYRDGSDYLATMNLNDYYYGWRNTGIVVIFILSSYACVYLMMKLRTKASKKAE